MPSSMTLLNFTLPALSRNISRAAWPCVKIASPRSYAFLIAPSDKAFFSSGRRFSKIHKLPTQIRLASGPFLPAVHKGIPSRNLSMDDDTATRNHYHHFSVILEGKFVRKEARAAGFFTLFSRPMRCRQNLELPRLMALFFLLFRFFCQDYLPSAQIALALFRNTRLFGSLATPNSTFWHFSSPPFLGTGCENWPPKA